MTRRSDRGRGNDEHLGHGHAGLDRCRANRLHECRDALRAVPRIGAVNRLKIVRAEHQYHERQGRVDLDALREAREAVTAGLERIFPDGAAAVQAILDHAHAASCAHEKVFHDTGPTLRERQPFARARHQAPAQRIAVDEDLLHPMCLPRFGALLRMLL